MLYRSDGEEERNSAFRSKSTSDSTDAGAANQKTLPGSDDRASDARAQRLAATSAKSDLRAISELGGGGVVATAGRETPTPLADLHPVLGIDAHHCRGTADRT